jgi:peptidoglycan/LPS O-acetylase OafA/YrhL
MQHLLAAENQRDSAGTVPAGNAPGAARFGGLDAIRGLAVIAGVILHASVAYMPSRMYGLLWPVHDGQTTAICHWLFWWLHAFRLPLFFVISGFIGEMLCESRGVEAFLKHRFRRIAIPFLACLVTVMPVTVIIWGAGLCISRRCSLAQAMSMTTPFDPEVQQNYFGPGHLWFLADLTIISLAFALIRREFSALHGATTPAAFRLPHRALAPLVLAVPTLLLLWGDVSPFISHHNTFIPDTARLSYYGLYFLAGVIAYRRKEHAQELLCYPSVHLPLSLLATVATLILLPGELAGESTAFRRFLLSASVSLVAWLSIFGLMGLILRYWKTDRPAFRYLADASYWIYIIHLPIVGLTNISLRQLTIGALPKFLSTSLISLTVAVLSYQAFVRYTWIGRALHGARSRENRRGEPVCLPGPHRELHVERGQPARVAPLTVWPHAPALPGKRRAA